MKPLNDYINPNITILVGEYLCEPCNGWGRIINEDGTLRTLYVQCPRCLGDGKLDWIENIVGKSEENVKGSDWRPRAITGVLCRMERVQEGGEDG